MRSVEARIDSMEEDRETSRLVFDEPEVETSTDVSRRGRVWVATGTFGLLLVAVGLVAMLSGEKYNMRATHEGLSDTISKVEMPMLKPVCTTATPPKLNVSIDTTKIQQPCSVPYAVVGIWKYAGEMERNGVKSSKYEHSMFPTIPYYMYLDPCVHHSHAGDDHCARQWVVQDPTVVAQESFTQMSWAPLWVYNTNDCEYHNHAVEGGPTVAGIGIQEGKPLAPPIGISQWRMQCGGGITQTVPLHIEAIGLATVTGKWSLYNCLTAGTTWDSSWDTDITSEKPLLNKDGLKAALIDLIDTEAIMVDSNGIPPSLVNIMTAEFGNNLKLAKPGTKKVKLNPYAPLSCYWVWQWSMSGKDIAGEMNLHVNLLSLDYIAWTKSMAEAPKCAPGHATDFPMYQACDSPDHELP